MIETSINGIDLVFETSSNSFSPKGIDLGTLAMLSCIELSKDDKVLDLGCGYGVVGIYIAKLIGEENVVMSDIDEECIELSKRNAKANNLGEISIVQSDGLTNITDNDFSIILSNPPYHSDFSVPKQFIEKGFHKLKLGGKIYMVTKRREWYKNKLIAIFGGVSISEVDGYFVFCSEKRSMQYANIKK